MALTIKRMRGNGPILLAVLMTVIFHGPVCAALAPMEVLEPIDAKETASGVGSMDFLSERSRPWYLPSIQWGGVLSYGVGKTAAAGQTSTQSSLLTTLNVSTGMYLWQPWVGNVSATLGFTNSTSSQGNANTSGDAKNVAVTGAGQLNMLPESQYPFEAHFQLSDSRATADNLAGTVFSSETFGFTQRYYTPLGDASFSWDRNVNHSAEDGRDQQDTIQARVTAKSTDHRFLFLGENTTGAHDMTSERTSVTSFGVQYGYVPNTGISVQNLLHVSQSKYDLLSGQNDSQVVQLGSNAYWRSDDQRMAINAGIQVFSVDTRSAGFAGAGNASGNKTDSANANLSVNYELNKLTRLNASININQGSSNGLASRGSSQRAGVNFTPESMPLGDFRYRWSTSADVDNTRSIRDSRQQMTLQLNHNLARSIRFEGGSSIGMDLSQGISFTAGQTPNAAVPTAAKQLNHSASLSWDLPQETGAFSLRLTGSDSRSLDGPRNFYQMVNLQISNVHPVDSASSWNGSFTVQSVRQGSDPMAGSTSYQAYPSSALTPAGQRFVTHSSGSINYQNQNMFGVRRLRFNSALRLNGQSFLPIFASAKSPELAAWENRFEYAVGRTQLHLSFMIASNGTPQSTVDSPLVIKKVRSVNKSIMFSASRGFGGF